ncbi:MAG TPA: undecaprenyldiphospho-muramoylpentapeptide beta-N-acetylglucosaminyltransferase [Bacteroidia bacterium]|nr:undecaprenyldiphospho-muramoylpentapeptide beta-N-acetylglucosaminyltransferase [Bacteroidia bacterium]HRS58650.1 undecaprenyldiphospho-muramoylpentapeptide beta-N-acetylglucosaminyltransferase [Bacteroidia bacterium]HRU67857.1 undecaprenyldiphospho-muramoylpentapeptide beta-N-acetylglucosaminyltransferase [Bacteroidia bacterium]
MNHTTDSSKMYRFIISGGGTGGHLFPAIAIANKLRSIFPNSKFLFVGALGKLEMEKVPLEGYEIKGLWISGFQRDDLWKNITLPLKLIYSFLRSYFILKKFKPHIAIGTGGYASFPLLYIASILKIPTIIQEQNFFPGISNKLLAKKVDRVCTVYSGMEKYFPSGKIIITGNPVRDDIRLDIHNKDKYYQLFSLTSGKKTLLVLGGSLGARTINEALLRCYEKLLQSEIQIIWQAGRYHHQLMEKFQSSIPSGLFLTPFIQQMAEAYSVADLVVSRAGAITLSELAVMEKPAILIPSPNVTEDHQTKNAMALVEKQAAILITDKEAVEKLGTVVTELIHNEKLLNELSQNISLFSRKESTAEIAEVIVNLIEKK